MIQITRKTTTSLVKQGSNVNDTLTGSIANDSLYGFAGNDSLSGLQGDDYLQGDDGNDSLDGGAGNDTLYGVLGVDSLLGGDGNDYLNGDGTNKDSSSDTLDGGAGNDTLDAGAGNDLLYSGIGDDTLNGGAGKDTLFGGDGNDYLGGDDAHTDGNGDSIDGGAGNDTLDASFGNDTLNGGVGKDTMYGGAGNDSYYVNDINDFIYDTSGDDTVTVSVNGYKIPEGIEHVVYTANTQALPYFINTVYSDFNWGDVGQNKNLTFSFVQAASNGQPVVADDVKPNIKGFMAYSEPQKTAVRAALAAYSAVAGLTFTEKTDSQAVQLRFFRDDLTSNNTLNITDRTAGYTWYPDYGDVHIRNSYKDADFVKGQYGFELLLHEIGHGLGLKHPFESPALMTSEDNTANTVMSYTHQGSNATEPHIFDIATVQYLYGVSANYHSDNDTYHFSDHYIGDGAGIDSFSASEQTLATYINLNAGSWNYVGTKNSSILASNQSFIGYGSAIENVIGGNGNDTLTGNNLNNSLTGGAGNDTLNGSLGIDSLNGSLGNDVYIVDSTTDIITETTGQGADTIQSSVSYSLSTTQEIENLTLTGNATNATGNALNNSLTGNNLNNSLNGGGGNDTLNGGLGNDVYIVDSTTDIINESVNQGADTIQSSVSYSLSSTQEIESLTLTGNATNATGNTLNNTLTGNSGANTLTGGLGADILIGGLNKDSLILTESTVATDTIRIAAGDSLVTNFDVITSFKLASASSTIGTDKLDLASTIIAANTNAINGKDVGIIHSHKIVNGLISFDDVDTYASSLTLTSATLINAINYVQSNITTLNNTVAFSALNNTYVFQDASLNDSLIQLTGVNATALSNTGLLTNAVWLV